MQIVIELSEKDLDDIKYNDYIEGTYYTMLDAITNGTSLPKGHGRLIDADALIDTLGCSDRDIYCRATIEEDAKVIIKADEVE